MEHFNGSDNPTVYHGASSWESATGSDGYALPNGIDHGPTREDVRALAGGLPRVFALVQEFGEDVPEVVAYGLALPGGEAATVGVTARGFGSWRSADSAAYRLHSDLVWLGENGETSA
ncbi:hypothetical protein [Streptosporangium sp. NPDC049046]|uniref:hypothetical protein n=1 Tax=unclassified Streptosporangium TaxID=2632669 RepID=UPI00341294BC